MKNNSNIECEIIIKDTTFPNLWKQQLEFSPPARGTWNIVHTGMLIPESHEIFVCAKGCLRGVVLTAAEAGDMGRYSALEISEDNVLNGDMETMMIDGVSDIIEKLSYTPRVIELFISCQHFFLAYDQNFVFEEIKKKFPHIDFVDCYMIPTLRKSGITPDQKMRIQMYKLLRPRKTDAKRVNVIGSNHRIKESSEIYELLAENGYELRSIHDSKDYDDYLRMAEAGLNIIIEPLALKAGEDLKERLGIPYIYLPSVFRPDDIEAGYKKLGVESDRLIEYRAAAHNKVGELREMLGDTEIVLDQSFTFRILNLARFLVKEGYNVTDIYLDAVLPEEEQDYYWLKDNIPSLRLHPISRPEMRLERGDRADALALGQKAAEFTGTDHFVNIAEGGGMFGFGGVSDLMDLIKDAFLHEKDRRNLIQKKGTGQRSLLDNSSDFCTCTTSVDEIKPSGIGYSACHIPTYSSDEFGACSSLYELGGMVVMHDASGCNSTYTTHDEPRWYDNQSMIYISALSEIEAIMGDDNKLIDDIVDAAAKLNPSFVAIVGAPIPYMMGTDFDAISNILEKKLGIPVFPIKANGMHDYERGIELALDNLYSKITSKMHEETELSANSADDTEVLRVNLLGITPLDYANLDTMDAITEWLASHNMAKCCSFTMGSSLDEIRNAAGADVNLVLSSGGLKLAKRMKAELGIPYVIGAPFGKKESDNLAKRIKNVVIGGSDVDTSCDDTEAQSKLVIIGEAVTSVSLSRAIENDLGIRSRVIASVECNDEILRDGDVMAVGEDAILRELIRMKPQTVVADPFYRPLVNSEIKFIPLGHEAFSGRIFDSEAPQLISRDLRKFRHNQ